MNAEYRPLQTGQVKFGPFDIAYALYSHGDVLKVVDPPNATKKMLVLADTIGHDPSRGKELSDFLDAAISQGWGVTGNLAEEQLKLSRMVPEGTNYGGAPFSYTQFENDKISTTGNVGGLTIVRNTGRVEEIPLMAAILDFYENNPIPLRERQYEPQLRNGEILFLRTDGVDEGIADSRFTSSLGIEHGGFEDLGRAIRSIPDGSSVRMRYQREADELLKTVLQKNRYKSAHGIVDSIIDELGEYFIPKTEVRDDASLVIVKRAR
ncbi:MAG: hypothetical protein IH934_06550 [Nanoarchaeota archaeon]|nr:hypothetical protein [Nanoarchaeota archaeon]